MASIPRFLVLGNYLPSVVANLPENNLSLPAQITFYEDGRTFDQIGPAGFDHRDDSIMSGGQKILHLTFENDTSTCTKLKNIWETHAANASRLYSVFSVAANLSLAYGVYRLFHRHSIKYNLFFTALFGLIAASAKAEAEFAQEQLGEVRGPYLNFVRGMGINDFRNAILREGFGRFLANIHLLSIEDKRNPIEFFTKNEVAALVAKHLEHLHGGRSAELHRNLKLYDLRKVVDTMNRLQIFNTYHYTFETFSSKYFEHHQEELPVELRDLLIATPLFR